MFTTTLILSVPFLWISLVAYFLAGALLIYKVMLLRHTEAVYGAQSSSMYHDYIGFMQDLLHNRGTLKNKIANMTLKELLDKAVYELAADVLGIIIIMVVWIFVVLAIGIIEVQDSLEG